MKIIVTFDKAWFFSEGGLHSFSANKLASLCRKTFSEEIVSINSSMNVCEMELKTDRSSEDLQKIIRELISKNIAQGSQSGDFYEVRLGDSASGTEDQVIFSPTQAPEQAGEAPRQEGERRASAAERIDQLVGLEEFKALCGTIRRRAVAARRNHTENVFLSEAYLFSANPGYGCRTAEGLLADLLKEESILAAGASKVDLTLPSRSSPEFMKQMESFVKRMEDVFKAPHAVTIDMTGWKGFTHMPEFKELLLAIFRHNQGSLVIFRMGYESRSALEEMQEDFRDILFTTAVRFSIFTEVELRQLAERGFGQYGFAVSEDAWPVLGRKFDLESRDGHFYGAHTVRKVINEAIRAAELYEPGDGAVPEEAITPASIASLLPPDAEPEESIGMETLDEMVGMEDIAGRVREIVNSIAFARQNQQSAPNMHMCFVGRPGTGKTTVARVIGAVLKEAGVLQAGKFFEHRGRDLIGQYVGHTAPITTGICRAAYGSVLFIDEAYTLAYGGRGSQSNDFGQEAIDTLIAEMENHRDELIVIVAGYPDEMQDFLDANPGMRDRVPYTIEFPNYTREQLGEIFVRMARDNFPFGEGFEETAREYFDSLTDETLEHRSFGNARFVRNLYERVWSKAAMRRPGVPANSLVLDAEDFCAAAEEMPEFRAETPRVRIGF